MDGEIDHGEGQCGEPLTQQDADLAAAAAIAAARAQNMAAIVKKYFRLPACAPNVRFMTSPPVGYALGVFRRPATGDPVGLTIPV